MIGAAIELLSRVSAFVQGAHQLTRTLTQSRLLIAHLTASQFSVRRHSNPLCIASYRG